MWAIGIAGETIASLAQPLGQLWRVALAHEPGGGGQRLDLRHAHAPVAPDLLQKRRLAGLEQNRAPHRNLAMLASPFAHRGDDVLRRLTLALPMKKPQHIFESNATLNRRLDAALGQLIDF